MASSPAFSQVIRILIADDHPVVRAGVRALLSTESSIEVAGEAGTPEQAVERAEVLKPDLVLMDLRFHGERRGVEATQALRALPEAPYVLILTSYDAEGDVLGAIEAGASGYILKDAAPHELVGAIIAAASGQSALAPTATRLLMNRMLSHQTPLSERETAGLALVDQGLANNEIAARLYITEATVKSHLSHTFTKLDVSTRSAAVSAARMLGLLTP